MPPRPPRGWKRPGQLSLTGRVPRKGDTKHSLPDSYVHVRRSLTPYAKSLQERFKMPSSQKGLSKPPPENTWVSVCLPITFPTVSSSAGRVKTFLPAPRKSLRALRFGSQAAPSTSPGRPSHFLLKNRTVVCKGLSRTSVIPRTVVYAVRLHYSI